MRAIYATLHDENSWVQTKTSLPSIAELAKLMGVEDVWEFEQRHAQEQAFDTRLS